MKNIYLYYKGKYYDVGTVVKIKTKWCGIKEVTFRGWKPNGCTFLEDGVTDNCYWFETEKYKKLFHNRAYRSRKIYACR